MEGEGESESNPYRGDSILQEDYRREVPMYTKGEWKLTDDGYVTAGEKYVHEPNNFGFQIEAGAIIPKGVMANSRLIAAAPAMLEALREFMKAVDNGTERIGAGREIKINAIIAKAEK